MTTDGTHCVHQWMGRTYIYGFAFCKLWDGTQFDINYRPVAGRDEKLDTLWQLLPGGMYSGRQTNEFKSFTEYMLNSSVSHILYVPDEDHDDD